jgi:hypothetical protein
VARKGKKKMIRATRKNKNKKSPISSNLLALPARGCAARRQAARGQHGDTMLGMGMATYGGG